MLQDDDAILGQSLQSDWHEWTDPPQGVGRQRESHLEGGCAESAEDLLAGNPAASECPGTVGFSLLGKPRSLAVSLGATAAPPWPPSVFSPSLGACCKNCSPSEAACFTRSAPLPECSPEFGSSKPIASCPQHCVCTLPKKDLIVGEKDEHCKFWLVYLSRQDCIGNLERSSASCGAPASLTCALALGEMVSSSSNSLQTAKHSSVI